MDFSSINWLGLKRKDYLGWRDALWKETQRILTISDKAELAQYNELGFFHKVSGQDEFEKMQQEWRKLKKVPQEWISKGAYPGIWTAMFSPHNTFSSSTAPILIIRFYFKEGYFLFDAENESHKELLESWLRQTGAEDNPWKSLKNSLEESLEERMKRHNYPSFKRFFEDNRFGALIGYSDYIAVVVILEDSIQGVEFSVLRQAAQL